MPTEAPPLANDAIASGGRMSAQESRADERRGRDVPLAFWIALAIAPFAAIYVSHFLAPNGIPTGFIQGDMPYYAANAREIFERGNGFAYPNPYDPDPNAPVIYFHWVPWILGFLIARVGLDPGMLFVAWGAAFALLMSTATWFLVRHVLPRPDLRNQLFLLTMWGGGLLCLGALAASAITGAPLDDILVFDPGNGWWFLNWGRNVTFPTEATYHFFVACCWLLALKGRQWPALAVGALLAATHPWSGLEILATLVGFHGLRLVVSTERGRTLPLFLTAAAALAAFLFYNLVFLESFEAHRALRHTWQIDWSLSPVTIVLAWSPVAVLAAIRIASDLRVQAASGSGDGGRVRWAHIGQFLARSEAVLVVAAATAFLLSIHDRFMTPTQPAHFTRGYVWMPLMLLGLPVVQRGLLALRGRLTAGVFSLALVGLVMLASFDNFVFVVSRIHFQQQGLAVYFLSTDQRDMLEEIQDLGLSGVTVARDQRLGYILATYTALSPYAGHGYNTPDLTQRIGHVDDLFDPTASGPIPWLNDIQYALVTSAQERRVNPDRRASWRPVARAGDLTLYETRGNPGQTEP